MLWKVLPVWAAMGLLLYACRKETWITSPDAVLIVRADTLRFDTVFTTAGSVTRSFTLVNDNDRWLRISGITLAGGAASAYRVNINGQPATSVADIHLRPRDSMYVFVRVYIDPDNTLNPFLVRDSLKVAYNGNIRWVQLQAYGQNARFINGGTIAQAATWDAALPWVILRPLTIATGAVLTIEKGARIFCNANAPLIVNGSLRALGEAANDSRIIFRGDRTDAAYRDYPGGWPGIIFTEGSTGNLLRFTHVLNAYQAIIAAGNAGAQPAKLMLEHCIIDNAYDVGLFALNSSVHAFNCRITQCGNDGQPGTGGSNVILTGGGRYLLEHCTLATYANFFQNHRQPVLYMGNAYNGATAPLEARVTNSIVYGEGGQPENEIMVQRTPGPAFVVSLQHVLYKAKEKPANITETEVLMNRMPQFDSINTGSRFYNFRLKQASPAVNFGQVTNLLTDLDGLPRVVAGKPDLGSYERQ